MIERIHLRIMREIDKQGSVTAAANKLNLTQPALSHAIKKLEARLESKLWAKEGRTLRLTQAGQLLLDESKRLLPQLERLDEKLSNYASGDTGTLRIGMECYPCYRWLTRLIQPFLNQYPNIDVDVKQRFQFGGMAALFNHDIDMLVTPDPIETKGIQFFPSFNYEQVLVLNNTHPLNNSRLIEPKDLVEQTLYTYPVEPERLDIYKDFLLPANCYVKKRKTVEATEIMLELVAANRGVTVLPKWLVDEYRTRLPITTRKLGNQGIQKTIYLGIRSNGDTGIADKFLDMAKSFR